ncbi:MAG: hypothetical protein EOM25_08810 [Deltaproteobacteria bacterium]|nr:hypothetical protein [Deltaproteobacteria bacterium]
MDKITHFCPPAVRPFDEVFATGLCPFCMAEAVRTDRTMKPYRSMVCTACGQRWTTVSVNLIWRDCFEQAHVIEEIRGQLSKLAT